MDPMAEEEQRRRFQSVVVVVVAEASAYTSAVVTAEWTGSWQRGPNDGRADGAAAMVGLSGNWHRGPGGGGGGDIDSVASKMVRENLAA
jgi:hypothetical protein